MRVFGIILIILGALALAFKDKGIPYTREEEVVKVGDFGVKATKQETIPLPWYVGAIGIGAGALLILGGGGGRKR